MSRDRARRGDLEQALLDALVELRVAYSGPEPLYRPREQLAHRRPHRLNLDLTRDRLDRLVVEHEQEVPLVQWAQEATKAVRRLRAYYRQL